MIQGKRADSLIIDDIGPEDRIERCPKTKMGEYNPLRCCRSKDHDGHCNWVVSGPAYKYVDKLARKDIS